MKGMRAQKPLVQPWKARTLKRRILWLVRDLIPTPTAVARCRIQVAAGNDTADMAGRVHNHQVAQPQQREHAVRPLCGSLLPARHAGSVSTIIIHP